MHVCLGVRDALLEGAVGVRPVLLQRVVLRRQQVVHRGPQPLGPGPGSWGKIFDRFIKKISNIRYNNQQSVEVYLEMPGRCSGRNEPRFPEC